MAAPGESALATATQLDTFLLALDPAANPYLADCSRELTDQEYGEA